MPTFGRLARGGTAHRAHRLAFFYSSAQEITAVAAGRTELQLNSQSVVSYKSHFQRGISTWQHPARPRLAPSPTNTCTPPLPADASKPHRSTLTHRPPRPSATRGQTRAHEGTRRPNEVTLFHRAAQARHAQWRGPARPNLRPTQPSSRRARSGRGGGVAPWSPAAALLLPLPRAHEVVVVARARAADAWAKPRAHSHLARHQGRPTPDSVSARKSTGLRLCGGGAGASRAWEGEGGGPSPCMSWGALRIECRARMRMQASAIGCGVGWGVCGCPLQPIRACCRSPGTASSGRASSWRSSSSARSTSSDPATHRP